MNWISQYLHNDSRLNGLCLTDQTLSDITITSHQKASQYLGHEFNTIVYDAFCGFYPNTFALVEGTLIGGGLFFLLTPELEQWPQYRDAFSHDYAMHPVTAENMSAIYLQRMTRLLTTDKTVSVISETNPSHIYHPEQRVIPRQTEPPQQPYKTNDQQLAVQAICQMAKGHRHRPLVLLSRRGYGKSSALGIASALMVEQGNNHIIITAPRRTAVNKVFEQAARYLQQTIKPHQSTILYQSSTIEFLAPDELLRNPRAASMLMIDEAAALPVSMLKQLLLHYPRVVLSSTVLGYEGHGRGFEIQFLKHLDKQYHGWKQIEMYQPVRWEKDDPLAAFSSEAFLYHTCSPDVKKTQHIKLDEINMHEFDKDQLLTAMPLFTELFSLLNTAHYKTSPDDLRIILDSPFIHLYYLEYHGDVVACALIVYEGSLPPELASHIIRGERRIHGHLLPQTLLAENVSAEIASADFARIMRIAVIPALQQRGIGSLFLKELKDQLVSRVDFIGASFGAEPELINFWEKANYQILRLGRKPNAFTGRYPLLMLQAISDRSKKSQYDEQAVYARKFLYLLSDSHQRLPYNLVITLLVHFSSHQLAELTSRDYQEVKLFSSSHRQYDSCVYALHLFIIKVIQMDQIKVLSEIDQSILIQKLLQKQQDDWIIEQHKLKGKADLLIHMREGISELLTACEGSHMKLRDDD